MNSRLHRINRRRLSPEAVHLSPAGDSRLHMVTERVAPDQVLEVAVMSDRMRSRPNNGHLPSENIDQLGQFVETCFAQPSSNPRDPFIAPDGLLHGGAIF